MGKRYQTGHRKNRRAGRKATALLLLLIAVVCLMIGGIGAKYIRSYRTGSGIVTSDAFYFAVDLLGDSRMVTESGELTGDGYKYEDVQAGTWRLYGGSRHEITFQIRNYYDELRITQAEIAYTVTVTVKSPEGQLLENAGLVDLSDKIDDNDETVESAIEGTEGEGSPETKLEGSLGTAQDGAYGQDDRAITLTVASADRVPYADGTEVVIAVQSTAPYSKTIELHFLLYSVSTYLRYEVRDSVGSPYAELVLMADSVGASGTSAGSIQPYLEWPEELSVDNTNSLTFIYTDGSFRQQPGMADRNMQISRALQSRESESLYFFKEDVTKNYGKESTIVDMDTDGTYRIPIKESGQ